MGSRTSEVLSEIDQIRSRLDGRLDELERRLPPLAQAGRKVAAIALGGGAGGGALLLLAKRRRRKRKDEDSPQAQPAPVTVKVMPPGTVAVAAAGVLVWAGVRLAEAWMKRSTNGSASGEGAVRPMPVRTAG